MKDLTWWSVIGDLHLALLCSRVVARSLPGQPQTPKEAREGATKIRSGGRLLQSGYALLTLTAAGSAPEPVTPILTVALQ